MIGRETEVTRLVRAAGVGVVIRMRGTNRAADREGAAEMGDAAVSYTTSDRLRDVPPLRLDNAVTATRPVVLFTQLFAPRGLVLAARSR
jgi:hypothetical protein